MDAEYLKLRFEAFALTVPVLALLAVQPAVWWLTSDGRALDLLSVAAVSIIAGIAGAAAIEGAKLLRFGLTIASARKNST